MNNLNLSSDALKISHMAYLRKRYRDQHLSEEATELMLKSWRSKTNKFYDSLFTKWYLWCTEQGSDPFSSSIIEVTTSLHICTMKITNTIL